jgi:hypothetical protein
MTKNKGEYRIFPDTIIFENSNGQINWHTIDCGEVGTLCGRATIGPGDRTLFLASWFNRYPEEQFRSNEEAHAYIAKLPPWTKTQLVCTAIGVVMPTCEL